MSPMSLSQQIITIAACVLATMVTRFLPFIIFSGKKTAPVYIQYLGKALPCAIFGMLVIYCLKDVKILSGTHGIPEVVALCLTLLLQRRKGNMLLSIAGGTMVYMILVQLVF